jgi:hypothetical protein
MEVHAESLGLLNNSGVRGTDLVSLFGEIACW